MNIKKTLTSFIIALTVAYPAMLLAACGTNTFSASLVKATPSYLSATSNAGITNGAFTFSLWFNATSFAGGLNNIIGQQSNASHIQNYINTISSTLLRFSSENCNIGAARADAVVLLNTGTWYNVQGRMSAGGAMDLRLNGASVATQTGGQPGGGTTCVDGFAIGANDAGQGGTYTPTTSQNFDGLIDDVRIYNADIGSSAADDIYNNPSNCDGTETNIISCWNMNSSLTADLGSNALTLTNTGTVTQSSTVPFAGTACASSYTDNNENFFLFF